MLPCLVASVLVALGPGPLSDMPRQDELRGAAAAHEKAFDASTEDVGAALRLVASLVLAGDLDRAREVALRLWRKGILSPEPVTPAARAPRIFELLLRVPPDPEGALSLLAGPPPTGDVKWLVARAFALTRAGESVRAATAFEDLARVLREGAGIQVSHFRFVRRVESFGVYEDDTRAVFRPGDRLMAYAELAGFACVPVPPAPGEGPGGKWRVKLEVKLRLRARLDDEPFPVWGPDGIEHVTRVEVRDLHLTRLLALPEDLAAGEYELRLEVRDLQAEGKIGLGLRRMAVAGR